MPMETRSSSRLFHGILFCCLAATLPPALLAQDHPEPQDNRQTKPAEDAKPQPEKRAEPAAKPAARPAEDRAARPPQSAAKPETKPAARPAEDHTARSPQPAARPETKPGESHATRPQEPATHPEQRAARPEPAHSAPAHTQTARPQPVKSQAQPGKSQPGTRPPANSPPANGSAHGRPPQWGRPPQHRASYSFRSTDRNRLRTYYSPRMGEINRANRPVFNVGAYYPYADIEYLQPVSQDVYGDLPPPPPGYQMAYYDGYVIVYDPITYFIAAVIDLLQ
jgi:hypothetical protein